MKPSNYIIPTLPLKYNLETKEILKQVNKSNKKLAELKGVALTIPNEEILISCLTLQEARDSSSIENIVTTQDDLYRAGLFNDIELINAATKEVLRYRNTIMSGFHLLKEKKVLTSNVLQEIQKNLEQNSAGFRKTPGTTLKSSKDGRVVYMPPQTYDEIIRHMNNLEAFINDKRLCDYDPLIKMAIIHHQFESIHPFYDGNGRTGRILNILYLVYEELLDLPILYLSKFITHHKAEYYQLIQAIRDNHENNEKEWENWILFMLKGVEYTSEYTINLIKGISGLMNSYKKKIKNEFGNKYTHELLNNLFFHPYTKIEFMANDTETHRNTAATYLNKIVDLGLLRKERVGRENYYINDGLVNLFIENGEYPKNDETIITEQEEEYNY